MIEPTPGKTHSTRAFDIDNPSLYLAGRPTEDRGQLPNGWVKANQALGAVFVEIFDQSTDSFTIQVAGAASPEEFLARDSDQISKFLLNHAGAVYLDITELLYSTWAPILRAWSLLKNHGTTLYVVYAEPKSYARSGSPMSAMRYSLSDNIEGISPIPGFTRLSSGAIEESLVVPMLGFEGNRLAYLLETLQAPESQVWPMIGLPGFQYRHPFDSLLGNRLSLDQQYLRDQILIARANDPFDAFFQLTRLQRRHGVEVRVAPIGTKPHGVGAVLFALSNPERVQLVYDHPVRSPGRSQGTGQVLVYDVGALIQSPYFIRSGNEL